MTENQGATLIDKAIETLSKQKKRPDRFSVAKLVAWKHGLSESMVIDSVEGLMNEAAIYSRPSKHGEESLLVSKAYAEASSTDETEEGNEIENTQPTLIELSTNEDQIYISTKTPKGIGGASMRTPIVNTTPMGNQSLPRPGNTKSLADTISKLADSVINLNQLLLKGREKSKNLLLENFKLRTKNLELLSSMVENTQASTNPQGHDYKNATKAMEIRTNLITDAESFSKEIRT